MSRKWKRVISTLLVFIMTFIVCFEELPFQSEQVVKAATKQIDVWDIAGTSEEDTTLYKNHLSSTYWNTADCVTSSGLYVAVGDSKSLTIDDLTLTYVANDRLYNTGTDATKNYGDFGKIPLEFDDGYVGKAAYYCNGTGGSTKRFFTIANIEQGDRITVYTSLINTGNVTETLNFSNIKNGGTQLSSAEVTTDPTIVNFVAEEDGVYKIYSDTTNDGKFLYYRIVRTPGVQVSGSVTSEVLTLSDQEYQIKFTNDATQAVTYATVSGTSYEAVLTAGYTYTASIEGVSGYVFSDATKTITTDISQIQTGSSDNGFVVVAEPMATYSGEITGLDSNYDVSNLGLTFLAPEDSNEEDVIANITEGTTFSANLKMNVDYTIQLTEINDYEVTSSSVINITENKVEDIVVSEKYKYSVTGNFLGLDSSSEVTAISFENVSDSYSYDGTITDGGYSVNLRDGAYEVTVTATGYRTSTHAVVEGNDVTKNLLMVKTEKTEEPIEWKADIYVGYPSQINNYTTVNEALTACKAMNPTSEEQRITIHIAPGVYREQLMIETPYLSFVNDDPTQEVKLTWYYGMGYRYYSADETGYYNVENAYDQYEKNIVTKWGCATYISATANSFRAEGITFENSFNRYITEEELTDGVEVSQTESITYDRTAADADVTREDATERANALYVEANQAEFYNCTILGSQDTLYTGNTAAHSYYKNCVIEGNIDYIFGDGDVAFDDCELKWYGYSDSAVGGYITAARPNYAQSGYLFLNCTITSNTNEGMVVNPGYFGRPWGVNAKVAFVNTTLEDENLIIAEGWSQMNGNTPQNANYVEYNTTLSNETSADVSYRVTGVVTESPELNMETYFGEWTPYFYTDQEEEVVKHKVWIVGDSTVSAFNDSYFYPRYGWGTQLQSFFDSDKYEVVNLAVSGTSSKDYTTKAEYTTLCEGMSDGDYILIGFGHNDEKTESARYTNPNGDYTTEGSFANSLYTNYIVPAQAKGCTPILCSPIVRRTSTGTWSNTDLHITSDSEGFPGGDYPQAIRDLCAALNIPVIDLTAMTKELYDSLSPDATLYLHAWTSSKATSVDNTNTNIWGGTYNAYLIAKTIAGLNLSGLSNAILSAKIAVAPTKADYLLSNPDYVESDYDSNLADSTLWKDYGIWKGTVFGAIGSQNYINTTHFTLGADGDGAMNIKVANDKGKIAATSDGIAMYYYKVPVGSTFTLTATAKINEYDLYDQVSFGLMARDEMYVDEYSNDLLGDYVAAAPLKLTKKGAIWNCFARKSGVLTQGCTCRAQSITSGESYNLKIVGNSDGYACTFGEEETVAAGFDFPLTSIDSEYVYVGMFVSRNADVTFSNIKLVVDGQEVKEAKTSKTANVTFDSAITSSSASYEAVFQSDYVGTIDIYDAENKLIKSNLSIDPRETQSAQVSAELQLEEGENNFYAVYTPASDEGQGSLLGADETLNQESIRVDFTVNYLRTPWSQVNSPVITKIEQVGSNIVITFTLAIGENGADQAVVSMYRESQQEVTHVDVTQTTEANIGTATFTPTESGNYTFKVIAKRTGEEQEKESELSSVISFTMRVTQNPDQTPNPVTDTTPVPTEVPTLEPVEEKEEFLVEDGRLIYCNLPGDGIVKIPDSIAKTITEISADTFQNNDSIISVDLSNTNIKTISRLAFENCKNLKEIILPPTLERIDASAFRNCTSLEKVELPVSLMSISMYAFANCSSLKSVTLERGFHGVINATAFSKTDITIYGYARTKKQIKAGVKAAKSFADSLGVPFICIKTSVVTKPVVTQKGSFLVAQSEDPTVSYYQLWKLDENLNRFKYVTSKSNGRFNVNVGSYRVVVVRKYGNGTIYRSKSSNNVIVK